jgi:hypothetical protein
MPIIVSFFQVIIIFTYININIKIKLKITPSAPIKGDKEPKTSHLSTKKKKRETKRGKNCLVDTQTNLHSY